MQEFDELVSVAERLLGPGGCSWDHKQTFFSLQSYVLEEAHEVLEAVDRQKDEDIVEELGDLLYVVLFYAKLAEKQKRFSLKEILSAIRDKAIRRHPHVFADVEVKDDDEIVRNFEKIKQEEQGKKQRKHVLEGIPDQLPLLTKAQKMHRAFLKQGFSSQESPSESDLEDRLSSSLWALVEEAQQHEVDLESAFRRKLTSLTEEFLQTKQNLP